MVQAFQAPLAAVFRQSSSVSRAKSAWSRVITNGGDRRITLVLAPSSRTPRSKDNWISLSRSAGACSRMSLATRRKLEGFAPAIWFGWLRSKIDRKSRGRGAAGARTLAVVMGVRPVGSLEEGEMPPERAEEKLKPR